LKGLIRSWLGVDHADDHSFHQIGQPFVNASNSVRTANANASSKTDSDAQTLEPIATTQTAQTTTLTMHLSGYAANATTSKPPKNPSANASSNKPDSYTPCSAANTSRSASESPSYPNVGTPTSKLARGILWRHGFQKVFQKLHATP
jgi:hypothetical protein